ncbi:MAG: DUF7507 domain-containing protein, partial [Clostridium sp.]|uniref:DUF7507 domain-containing protein n=1 Tax=Clostridium sp. TaxID=1506 RepID=UPI003F2B7F89
MENFNDLNIGNDINAQATGPLTMNKVVDKAQGVVGDTLTYTITITNPSGSGVNTSPIAFQDTVPTGTVLLPGTLLVDGTPNTGDVQAGLTLSGLAPGESHQVIFKVLVTTFPGGVIKNDATIDYTWGNGGVFPNRGGNVGQAQTVPGPDVNGRAVLTKSVDKTTAAVGEEVTYTLVAGNIGSVTINNVTITDTIPQGTSYVSNSTTINNGAAQNTNPQTGINVGTLTSGQSATIVFKVKVDTIPNPNPFFNQGILGFQFNNGTQTVTGAGLTGNVFTTVTAPSGGSGSISINKSTDKTTAAINETITYTVVLTNNGTLPYTNLQFVDTIPNGTTFVSGSVNVNGTAQPTFNPQTGFAITPPLAVGGVATVTYSIQATTIPTPNPIVNVANGIFQTSSGSGSNLSNAVNTTITTPASGSASITKSVDKTNANIGDQLTYTAVIRNNGNLPLTSLVFTDTIQASGVTFVSNSATVNGSANT